MKIKCCCCAKQIVTYRCDISDKYITEGPVTLLGPNEYCCKECSKDLDENGLFPEERNDL